MSATITKTGVARCTFIESQDHVSVMKDDLTVNPNMLSGCYSVRTTYSGGNVVSRGPIALVGSLVPGQTYCFTFDYSVEGDKYDTSTAWDKCRYGSHLTLVYTASGASSSTTTYPCAGYLTMSGTGTAVQTFTVPAGCTVNGFSVAVQTYNKPAEGNNAVWYLKNFKLEAGSVSTPWVPSSNDGYGVSGGVYYSPIRGNILFES